MNTFYIRIITIGTAALFIPAFIYGLAGVWAVVFSVLLALLFDARLKNVIATCEPIEREGERCRAVLGQYFLLMLEMTVITTVMPLILLYSDLAATHRISDLDAFLLNYAPLSFLKEGPYQQDEISFQILVSASSPVVVSVIGTFFLSWRKLMIIAHWVLYAKRFTGEGKDKKYHSFATAFYLDWSSTGGAFALIFVLFYVTFLQSNGHSNNDYATLLVIAPLVIYLALGLNFTSFAAMKK